MLRKLGLFKKLSKKQTIEETLKQADKLCFEIISTELSHLDILGYTYTTAEAIDELGLDDDLMHQLVEDYVIQIIKASIQFDEYLELLELSQKNKNRLDYTPFRELAHKNLGVARNLRIKDAEKLLYELMKKDELTYLKSCLEALKACSIKLKPECAYNTLNLIAVKNSF